MTRRSTPRVAVLTALAVTAGSLLSQAVGAPTPAGAEPITAREGYVRQVYTDALLDADPAQADVDAAVATLAAGTTGSNWVGRLLLSDVGRLAFVEGEYERILDRPLEAGAGGGYVNLMKDGKTRQGIRSLLVGSPEYFRTHGGSTVEGFVRSTYVDLLGRDGNSSDIAFWSAKINGGLTRDRVAGLFQEGQEGRKVRATTIFRSYLKRGLDAGGQSRYSNRLKAGATEENVIAEVASSPEYRNRAAAVPAPEAVALLTQSGSLTIRRPGSADRTLAVTGLTASTTLVGIDVRPATGVLYGLGSDGQVYGISTGTGTADKVGAPIPSFDASAGVGFDFNPAADRLRIVTGAKNYRLQPDTGAVLGEGAAGSNAPGSLQYVAGDPNEGKAPGITAAAYTNSTRGLPLPTSTAIYDIDTTLDVVVEQNPANSGNLITKGPLRLDATAANGFDISPDGTQVAYAVLSTTNGQGLYKVDLATGEPKLLEKLAGDTVVGLAVLGTEAVAPTEAAFGVSTDGLSLISFTTTDPTPTATQTFAGLTLGTRIVAIDVRPSTGQLFAIGSDGQLYTVDTSVAGVATVAKANIFTGQIGGGTFDASQGVAMDFNPAADRIRVVVGTKNYRVQTNGVVDGEGPPNTGLPGTIQYVAGDPGAGTTPAVTGAAYTNSARSATLPTATALYDIETNRNVLVRQNPANAGDLTTIGPLGIDVGTADGFDVSGGPGQNAYAVLETGGVQSLYLIDLATGRADLVGTLPTGLNAFALK
ncbi:DUF4394 domain-containing protein [Aquihabitans sp. G128]|uniref:DUF4394 domain-containing protein n=1 Tax=Aquihabitans sp. G128 TaxID=2849779 RepID=UPI001C223FA0|nr:DUF4394 domain-containing protein [Aquihabitans sp. G128]QXC62750.1 DUF4394 domain-containing protein [Aquihabitans sp. G128]